MDGISIFIKSSLSLDDPQNTLLKLCKKLSIKITKLTTVKNDFKVFMENSLAAEKLFEAQSIAEFSKAGFEALLPPFLISQRTVLTFKLDKSIMDRNDGEIKNEIHAENSNIKVTDIFIFRASATMKLILKSTDMVTQILHQGLFLFYLHIPGRNFKKDVYVDVTVCSSCGKINSHQATVCPKKNRITCLRCASTAHKTSDCPPGNPLKCLNCFQCHHTLARRCPERKKIIAEIRRSKQGQNSFSNITNGASSFVRRKSALNASHSPNPSSEGLPQAQPAVRFPFPPPPLCPPPVLPELPSIKISMIIQLALVSDFDTPGSFKNTFNEMSSRNGLPEIDLISFKTPSRPSIASLIDGTKTTARDKPTAFQISNNPATNSASSLPPSIPENNNESPNSSIYESADSSDSDISISSTPPKPTITSVCRPNKQETKNVESLSSAKMCPPSSSNANPPSDMCMPASPRPSQQVPTASPSSPAAPLPQRHKVPNVTMSTPHPPSNTTLPFLPVSPSACPVSPSASASASASPVSPSASPFSPSASPSSPVQVHNCKDKCKIYALKGTHLANNKQKCGAFQRNALKIVIDDKILTDKNLAFQILKSCARNDITSVANFLKLPGI